MKLPNVVILFALVLVSFCASAHADYSCAKAPCFSVGANGWIVGEIRSFAFPAAPQNSTTQSVMFQELMAQGWVECAGQTLARSAFPKLFNAISDSWGSGDGRVDFYVPDLRGQTLRAWNHGSSQKQSAAFGGDPNAQDQTAPRPEVLPPGTPGNVGDNLGSIQGGLLIVGKHSHTNPSYKYGQLHDAQQGNGIGMPMNLAGGALSSGPVDGDAGEIRVNNAYVIYAIYVGAPVTFDSQTNTLKLMKSKK